MNTVYYFPKLPLELCAPAYVLYEDHPVRDTILDTVGDLIKDIKKKGLQDPLIAEIRHDRNGIQRVVTVVGIRRWTCLNMLRYNYAPFFIKGKKKSPVIKELKKYYKYTKIKSFLEAEKLFWDKSTPGTLMVRRWFTWDTEDVIELNN
jgi:hypothetical protein